MTLIPRPAPDSRPVLTSAFRGPLIRGDGDLSYRCGNCGDVLADSIAYEQVRNLVFQCFRCTAFNEVPALDLMN